jgi:hypothetical protein
MGSYEPTGAYPGMPVPTFIPNGPVILSLLRLTRPAMAGSVVLAVASLAMKSPWQSVVAYAAAAIALVAAAAVLARMVADWRSHSFQGYWLAAQTEALRQHQFEALRCTVRGRRYNLASPADVRDLRDQPGEERAGVSFSYLADGRAPTIGEVHRLLRDVTFVADVTTPGRAFARFPQARYLPRPTRGGRPARRTTWALDGPVLVSVTSVADATGSDAAACGA